ncbi:MAG: trigger factor [Mycobacteriales bacterium]|nr:MAG: trigger factor [Pseudonocardiales bacterium]
MKSTVETLSPTRARIAVEVPFDDLAPSLARAYKKIAQQVRVPGFRPGKAPARIIDQRIGRGAVLDEVVQDAVPHYYGEAVRETGADVMGQPDFEVTKLDDGDVLAFTAEVDVRPTLTLPDLTTIAVEVDAAEVTDAEVDEQLSALRDRYAVLKGVDRPVRDGDFVSIDLSADVDGEELADAQATGMSYEVGQGDLLPGLDTALSGMTAEESKTFTSELRGEREGEGADVTVTVRSVKEKELPELDDDFAQTASEFETLDELIDDVRARMARMRVAQQGVQAREKAMVALTESTDVPLPESVVANELQWRRDRIDQQLSQSGADLEAYLASQEETEEEFETELRTAAEEAVRRQLLLDAVADHMQVAVSEADLTEHIVGESQRFGVPPQQLADQLQRSGNIVALVGEVRRNKAVRSLLEGIAITDPAGNPVDLTAILGPSADDADADADETVAEAVGEQAQPIESVEEPAKS